MTNYATNTKKSFYTNNKINSPAHKDNSSSYSQKSYFLDFARASWSRREYKAFAEEAYVKNVIAHKAINIISRSASSIPLTLKIKRGSKYYNEESHHILDLLARPNPKESGKEFLYAIYAYRQIHGNAYILANHTEGQMDELYALRPDRVTVEGAHDFMPLRYCYNTARSKQDFSVDKVTGFCRVLHMKNFNPLDDFNGLSSIEAAAYSIDQHNQASAWNQSLLQNGARPSGALVVNQKDGYSQLTEEQFNRLKNMVEENFSGSKNSGKPMLLEGGLDWKEMSLSPKDMDFIECKNSAARDIALAFGVPPQLLGIPGDNTYSNLKEARLALWEQTVIPLVESTIEAFSNWFSAFYQEDVMLGLRLDDVPIFSEKRESLWERVNSATFLREHEKRKILGLDNDIS